MKETGKNGLQDKIVKSLRMQGGDALKTNGSFIKGTLDLIFFLPGFPLMLAEVKHIKLNTFDFEHRTIKTSPIQKHTLERFKNYSIQLIGIAAGKALRLYIAGPQATVLLPTMLYVPYKRSFDIDDLLKRGYQRGI